MTYYIYILKCSNGSFYTGYTSNLKKRFALHCIGKAAKYTRMNPPIAMIYYETVQTRSAAMMRERRIKQLSHEQKIQLLRSLTTEEKQRLLDISCKS